MFIEWYINYRPHTEYGGKVMFSLLFVCSQGGLPSEGVGVWSEEGMDVWSKGGIWSEG